MVSAYAVRLIGKLASLLGLLLLALGPATSAPPAGQVLALRVDGVIGPATADFIHRGLARAQAGGYLLVVLELDTPGGLDTSMRAIIKDILASPVPVATYVHPEGARAASAGTYILYASHIAAMTPATNLGAATPVAIGGTPSPAPDPPTGDKAKDGSGKAPDDAMGAKAVNDAAAYLRSLAQLRGRDADFAERAVREAAGLSAEEALARGVIDVVAPSLPALLRQLDGREVELAQGKLRLATADAAIDQIEPDGRNRFLALLANPQVALILMMIGIYGLFFEFTSPGFVVPGVAGAICLLLALYAFHLLPVNWAGVALVVVGCALMVAEAFAPSFGVLGIGGLVAFVIGGLFLVDGELPGFGIPPALIVGLSLASAALLFALGGFAARSRKRPVVSGREEMAGQLATVAGPAADGGYWVQLRGETWRAHAAQPLNAGDQVRIDGVDGLTLQVSPLSPVQRSTSP
ncbi:nodulation protein NfeD [Azoarcus sp. TTM-91]|uniref:NfeD family protein n=1 Tax=Azoarcus sp. TTM-91 TaxID=2691581 RepID=UPI00145ED765|nr:nodulation protein NfeD [Azoarcus sp. TTM-91]NMG36107.1 nodulation protein NfeD [Azoarcus sp. TTM-91]